MNPNQSFWKNKRVTVTGHTGFKGGWLTLWLHRMGANVTGIGLTPITTPNLFDLCNISDICESHICDIRDTETLMGIMRHADPEIVFHLAAQPLVRLSYKEPLDTFSTNVIGTANVLDAIRKIHQVRVGVMITTDKVYHNNEWVWPYKESDKLGGHDPYSSSKAASELIIESYRKSFFSDKGIAIASARAGNVIGGGDWSEDRLIPDAIRSWQSGKALEVRRPQAKRPWQHVLEPLMGYLLLAEKLWGDPSFAGAYNFGPHSHEAATVQQVIDIAIEKYGNGKAEYASTDEGPHEAGWLALEISKSREILGFYPKLRLSEAIANTFTWYKKLNDGANAQILCFEDIKNFEMKS